MTTQVVFKVDSKVKAKAMKRARKEGIPFAVVLKLLSRAFAEGRLSIDVTRPEQFNAKTEKEMKTALRDIEQGKNIVSLKNAKETDEYLLSV